jgi:hypothetical protein
MPSTIIIIDDFLDDPVALRDIAMGLDYPHPEQLDTETYFPGRNSAQRIDLRGTDEYVSRVTGERLKGFGLKEGSSHARFRQCTADEKGKGGVHIDHSEWSGILYLNPDEQAQGGTDFLRHKRTGMDRAPITPEGLREQGFSNYNDVWSEVLLPDGKNPDAWELEMRVPAKFNRLVLLRPNLFHNPTPGFGTSIQDARLVYLMFFKYA